MPETEAIVAELEELEAQDSSPRELLSALRRVENLSTLWEVAENVAPYIPVMRMVYRRALELGGSEATARGYLARAYAFHGDTETALALVRSDGEESQDPILLSAWIALADSADETLNRIQSALARCPNSLTLWRRLADQALRHNLAVEAIRAISWLLEHEPDERERVRLKSLLKGLSS